MLPWFAWVAIVAIIVYGGVQIVQLVLGRSIEDLEGSGLSGRLDELEQRIDGLETHLGELEPGAQRPALRGGAAEGGAEPLERRIERLEARADRREARDRDSDDWNRQAKDLGLED